MAHRSTRLGLVAKHCPAALDYMESGVHYDREVFAAGIAAHAVLEAHGTAGVAGADPDLADAVALQLVTHGRSFDGVPEPPMSPDAARDGRDLALRYLAAHDLPAGGRYEVGLAIARDGTAADYSSPAAWYRGILDVVYPFEVEDEDSYSAGIVVRDWKSAWPTGADELDTIQLRGQAVMAAAESVAEGARPDFVRREVVNLRTHAVYSDTLTLDDDGMRTLARWREDIALAAAAAEARGPDGRRPHRPGAGCFGCPFLFACSAVVAIARARPGIDSLAPVALAEAIAVHDAYLDALRAAGKRVLTGAPIQVPGGSVGYHGQTIRSSSADAPAALARAWFQPDDWQEWEREHGDVLGLLAALEPGSSAIERIGRQLYPAVRGVSDWKDDRAALVDRCLTSTTRPIFGVQRAGKKED